MILDELFEVMNIDDIAEIRDDNGEIIAEKIGKNGISEYWGNAEIRRVYSTPEGFEIHLKNELITVEQWLDAIDGQLIVKDNSLFVNVPYYGDTEYKSIDDLKIDAQLYQENGGEYEGM